MVSEIKMRDESAEEGDLRLVARLLSSLPLDIEPWEQAMGISGHKPIAVRLNRCFDRLMPGLISFPIPTAAKRIRAIASYNLVDREKVIAEIAKFASHSPKLTFADSDKDAVVPFDTQDNFKQSDNLIGSHSMPAAQLLDYYSGASNAAIFKQVRHIIQCGGKYALPAVLPPQALSAECYEHIRMLESIVKSGAMQAERSITTISGLPQVLIPVSDADGGYLSITPLACGGVIAAVAKAIKDFSVEQYEIQPEARQRKHILRSAFLPAVSNKQNLSGLIGPAKYVLFSSCPFVDKEARSAFTLAEKTNVWIKNEIRALRFSKEDPTFRNAAKVLREQITDVLSRGQTGNDSRNITTANERAHEVNSIRYLARPIIMKMVELTHHHHELFDGTVFDSMTDHAMEISNEILSGLASLINISVSRNTLSLWLDSIQVEIRQQLESVNG